MDAVGYVLVMDNTLFIATGMTMPAGSMTYADDRQPVAEVEQAEAEGMIHATSIDDAKLTETIHFRSESTRKSFMDYRTITDTSSRQWKFTRGGYLIDGVIHYDGYTCAALGSRFGKVGDRLIFTMSTGRKLLIIKAEQKQDKDTINGAGWTGKDGSVIELIVDSSQAPEKAVQMGDFNYVDEYYGKIIKVERLKN